MARKNLTISIDQKLAARIDRYRDKLELSRLASEAFEREIEKLEDAELRAFDAYSTVVQAGSSVDVSSIQTMDEDAFKKNLSSVFESVLANTPDYARDSVQTALNAGTVEVWRVRRASGR